jgi:hypothetical protein
MAYRVAHVKPKKIYMFEGKQVLECKCRIEENGEWQTTVYVRVPFPLYYEELYHGLCVHLDVGNIEYQQHLEYHIPREFPQMLD